MMKHRAVFSWALMALALLSSCLFAPALSLAADAAPSAGAAAGEWAAPADAGAESFRLYQTALAKYSAGDMAAADSLAVEAMRADPDYPPPLLLLARIHFQIDKTHAMLDVSDWLKAINRNIAWRLMTRGSVSAVIILALAGALIAGWLVLLFKSVPLFAHDAREKNLNLLLAAGAAALSAFGLALGIAAMSLLLWPYFSRREKLFMCLLPIFLISLPWLSAPVAADMGFTSNSRLKAVVDIQEGRNYRKAAAILGGAHEKPSGDFERFSLAYAQSRLGNDRAAIENYMKIGESWPDSGKALNNIGVCMYRLGETDNAVAVFEKAAKSGAIIPKFNLGQLYRERLRFEDGERLIREIQARDPEAVHRLMTSGKLVAEERLSPKALRKFVMERADGNGSIRGALMKPLLGPLPAGMAPWAGILVLALFIAGETIRPSRDKAYRCAKCGGIFCGRCERRPSDSPTGTCRICQTEAIRIGLSDSKDRIDSILRTQRYYDRRVLMVKALSVIPGMGSFLIGRWMQGAVLSFCFFAVIAFMTLGGLLCHLPGAFTPSGVYAAGAMAVLVAASVLLVRRGVRQGWR
ncbi:MAG: tetratricopeptide repeat protein [Nitrospirae bacterium]|nr:tetratricopeptide repeat protein [Nitrospirota bacterium]